MAVEMSVVFESVVKAPGAYYPPVTETHSLHGTLASPMEVSFPDLGLSITSSCSWTSLSTCCATVDDSNVYREE